RSARSSDSSDVGASRCTQVRPLAVSSARRGSAGALATPDEAPGRVRLMRGRLGMGTEGVLGHPHHRVRSLAPGTSRIGGDRHPTCRPGSSVPGRVFTLPGGLIPKSRLAVDKWPMSNLRRLGVVPAIQHSGASSSHAEGGSKPLRRSQDRWLDKWLRTTSDLARLQYSHPMVDSVVDEIDGRLIRIGNRWLVDFASCNYLGFDLEPEIIDAIPEYLDKWGTHPSWSRLLASPRPYVEIEERLTELLGAEDALLLPTITHIHSSVIPVLAGEGTLLLDKRAHKTIYDGCAMARSHGATVHRFAHESVDEVERILKT